MANFKLSAGDIPEFYKTRSIGFDRMFSELERTLTGTNSSGYPPYNIVRIEEDNTYIISLAVAGFTMDDLDVVQDSKVLTVTGTAPEQDESVEYLHRGIAGRSFQRKFQLADYVEVENATLELGVLNITLKQNVPDELLPKQIKIKSK